MSFLMSEFHPPIMIFSFLSRLVEAFLFWHGGFSSSSPGSLKSLLNNCLFRLYLIIDFSNNHADHKIFMYCLVDCDHQKADYTGEENKQAYNSSHFELQTWNKTYELKSYKDSANRLGERLKVSANVSTLQQSACQ